MRAAVKHGLGLEWSAQQMGHRLALDHLGDVSMRISHEAIYLSLFVPRRAPLPWNLTQQLRTRRPMRYPRIARQPNGRGLLKNMTS